MKTINSEIKKTKIDKLKEHPDNPRRGDEKAIEDSIKENGFYGVIVVQKSSGFVLAGNHRLRAAKKTGAKEIDVCFVDVDDVAAKKILLADNKTSDLGSYDDESLARLLDDIHADTSLNGTGYKVGDLDELIGGLAKTIDVAGFKRSPPASDAVDREQDVYKEQWSIVIDCENESDQFNTMKMLKERGLSCKALIS